MERVLKTLMLFVFLAYNAFAEVNFKPYGTFNFDAVKNSAGSVTQSTGNSVRSIQGINENLHSMHVRNSVLGLKSEADLDSFMAMGKLEVDFKGEDSTAANDVVASPRMKHAFVELTHKGSQIEFLVGQTYDLISPLQPNVFDSDYLKYSFGNVGFYRPQARLSREFFNLVEIAASAARPAGRETNSDSFDYTGRIAVDTKDLLGPFSMAVGSSHLKGRQRPTDTLHPTKQKEVNFHIHSYDVSLAVMKMAFLNFEYFDGSGLNQYYGIGNGYNSRTNIMPEGSGHWVELMFKVWMLDLGLGMAEAEVDKKADRSADGAATTTDQNNGSTVTDGERNWYNITFNFNSQVSAGFEYSTMTNTYTRGYALDSYSKSNERYDVRMSYKF